MMTGIGTLVFALFAFYTGLIIKDSSTVGPMLIIFSVFIYILAFVSTLGPIMWMYFAEVIQPNRVPFAVASNWLSNSMIVIFFPIIRASCGNIDCPPVFLFLAGCVLIALIVCKFFMVETKDKTELEIREEFYR